MLVFHCNRNTLKGWASAPTPLQLQLWSKGAKREDSPATEENSSWCTVREDEQTVLGRLLAHLNRLELS